MNILSNILVIYPKGNIGQKETQYFWLEVVHHNRELPLDILETVFRMMNHVDDSLIESQLKSFKCRSLSVGDAACVHGHFYRCLPIGWQKVESDEDMMQIFPPSIPR